MFGIPKIEMNNKNISNIPQTDFEARQLYFGK